jgi:hypothetical protein
VRLVIVVPFIREKGGIAVWNVPQVTYERNVIILSLAMAFIFLGHG